MMIDFELKLPPEQKDEFGYTPSENRVIEKQLTRPSPPKNLWKNFVKASEKTDRKDVALAQALIESNRLAEKETPKQTWERLDSTEKKRQQVVKNELAEKAKDKKHLTKLYIHGMEHSQEPVIKNPVLRKALEAKPKLPPKKCVNYLSNNYSFAENFKKQSKNIRDYKPTAKKPFKVVPKIKPGPPVKIDFKLDPMHTAGLWSNIKNSSLYKLLDNPKVMGVELGHEGIMEAYNLLQNSGLLKKGGRVK